MTYKTFKELGVSFQKSTGCLTCTGLSCHRNILHKNGTEYNVHISTDHEDSGYYNIHATVNASTSNSDDIIEISIPEESAVKLICENFTWFKCF